MRPENPASPAPGASESDNVTALLQQSARGDPGALERLMEAVHAQLRALAHAQMRKEKAGHTLQPTALVHEAYLRLGAPSQLSAQLSAQDRSQFFRAAVQAMRRILIDRARSKGAIKRGGGQAALQIASVSDALADENTSAFLELDEAMQQLAAAHPKTAEIVRLKFYTGADDATAAQTLGISERTVRREWVFARAWLRLKLQEPT